MKKTKLDTQQTVKRYNVNLPNRLFEDMQKIADKKHTSVVEILKQFIKIGLLIESTPDASFIIKTEDKERQIMLL